jgi:hypothetical protein
MTNSTRWKDYLLRSGLPLENDVKRLLERRGCVGRSEYSYLRENEENYEREFSYDIDASYIDDPYFVDLMVECKYRHDSTKWVFTPETYGGMDESYPTEFTHPQDGFVSLSFPFKNRPFPRLGELCGKGVELTPNGTNEKTIRRGVSQLVYALPEKISSSFEHQIYDLLVTEHIHLHVPILVTTAQLYRINEEISIQDIRQSDDLSDIARKSNLLVLKKRPTVGLERYSRSEFNAFRKRVGDERIREELSTFTKDTDHFFGVLTEYKCPRAVAVVHHNVDSTGLPQLVDYIEKLIQPTEGLKDKLQQYEAKMEKAAEELENLDLEK